MTRATDHKEKRFRGARNSSRARRGFPGIEASGPSWRFSGLGNRRVAPHVSYSLSRSLIPDRRVAARWPDSRFRAPAPETRKPPAIRWFYGGQGRDRTGDLPLFRRTLVPTELPGRTADPTTYCLAVLATLTGLEPATSAVTGRRANQLRHRALLCSQYDWLRTPNGIRTRATAVKGRRPRPLDDGGPFRISPGYPQRVSRWELAQLRAQLPQNPNRITSVLARTLDQYPVSARPYSSVGRATDF